MSVSVFSSSFEGWGDGGGGGHCLFVHNQYSVCMQILQRPDRVNNFTDGGHFVVGVSFFLFFFFFLFCFLLTVKVWALLELYMFCSDVCSGNNRGEQSSAEVNSRPTE